jgi:curved DNA-binding protein CbpA
MQRIPDPYRVLGVGREATPAEIKAAHRRLAKRFHPDAAAADEPVFLAVQGAYELLKDPLRRAEWDRKHAPGPVRADEPTSSRSPVRKRPFEPKPSESARPARPAQGPKAPPWTEPGRRTDHGPDPDVYNRSSGAAWSSAARAYFRRASADMPSGAANPNTPRWTTPVGTAPKPRYDAPPGPAPAAKEASPRAATARHPPEPAWPTGVQRIESALTAALPFALVAGFGAVGRLGPRSAGIVALVVLVVAWFGFYAKPRAAWLATRGALGGVMGYLAYLGASLVLPLGASVLTSFILAILSIGAVYAAGVALALRDVPVRRPWLPPPGSPD